MTPEFDARMMAAALKIARRNLGATWPNPAVGCVLARDGEIVGRGWTAIGGRPHAEVAALAVAGEAARGATAYCTLEPCSHHGQTPPCVEALMEAGVARVVVAARDPDPRVDGSGVARLRAAGLQVDEGLMRDEAAEANAGFILRVAAGRPMVTLKLAATLDGRIATRRGASRWITGREARARIHLMRANHDAVAIGVGTAIDDDPKLDVRLPGLEHRSPAAVIFDGGFRLPLEGALVAQAARRRVILLGAAPKDDAVAARRDALRDAGCETLEVRTDGRGWVEAEAALRALGDLGVTRLFVEGGRYVAGSLLNAGLVDRLVWCAAPRLIGGDGAEAVASLGVDALRQTPRFRRIEAYPAGDDMIAIYRRIG